MPSPLGGQWKLLRHYLSQVSKGNVDQWESLLRRLEKIVSPKLFSKSELDSIRTTVLEDAAKQTAVLHTTGDKERTTDRDDSRASVENKINTPREPLEQSKSLGIDTDLKNVSVETILDGLRLKRRLARGDITEKTADDVVSKSSIHARTAYVISALVSAQSRDSLVRRTDSFIQHLMTYPEARDLAIKEGGGRTLLRVQSVLNDSPIDQEVNGLVKEALALLGHAGPCRGPGPNILSIDGGGVRGLIAIEILKALERQTGRRVNELFDYMVGVSTGAIIAAVLSSGKGNLETASELYHTLSKETFGSTSLLGGTSRLVLTQSYYDTEAWEKLLKEWFLDSKLTHCNRLNTPKMALVSCVVNSGARLSPFLFRSYETPYRVRSVFPGTTRALVWQAVRASAAAPTYFTEFQLDGLLHQDGGIMVNNPSGIALHESRLLFGPESLRRGCVISVGTGRPLETTAPRPSAGTTWKDKFNKILDSATDTEGVHVVLNDLLPEGSYFRLNPPLNTECAMDEVSPDKLNSMLVDTQGYLRRNRHKMQQAARMLTRPRGIAQRVGDVLTRTGHVMGIRQAN